MRTFLLAVALVGTGGFTADNDAQETNQAPTSRPATGMTGKVETSGGDPRLLVRQGRDLYNMDKFDEAEKVALRANAGARSVSWSYFEDTPDKLLNDIKKSKAKVGHEESVYLLVSPDLKNSPVGAWMKTETDQRGQRAKLTITADKLTWSSGSQLLEADYSLTKDSLLYAVITKASGSSGIATAGSTTRTIPSEDDTFSFRFRADDDELRVQSVKGVGIEELVHMAGRYRKVPGDDAPQKLPKRTSKQVDAK